MSSYDGRRLLEERLEVLRALHASTVALREAIVQEANLDQVEEAMRERSTAVAAVLSLPPVPPQAYMSDDANLVAECEHIARDEARLAAEARDILIERQNRISAAIREAAEGTRAYQHRRQATTGRRFEAEG